MQIDYALNDPNFRWNLAATVLTMLPMLFLAVCTVAQ